MTRGWRTACLALLAAFAVLAAAPEESLADNKDKRKQTPRFVVRAPERKAPRPTPAPARETAVPPVPPAASSAALPAATEGATRESASSGGTITTEEARAKVVGQPLPEPPAPAVDPLSLITLPERAPVARSGTSAWSELNWRPDPEAPSFFPVPAPVLALLLVGSPVGLFLGIRAMRRMAPDGQASVRVT